MLFSLEGQTGVDFDLDDNWERNDEFSHYVGESGEILNCKKEGLVVMIQQETSLDSPIIYVLNENNPEEFCTMKNNGAIKFADKVLEIN